MVVVEDSRFESLPRGPICMNIHVSEEIRKKYPNVEFRGKPFSHKNKTLIEARNHHTDTGFYYCFEEDFLWHSKDGLNGVPEYYVNSLQLIEHQ